MWGVKKNLPVETAHFMVVKAKQRRQAPDRKETIFTFGGMQWTSERAEMTIKGASKGSSDIAGMLSSDVLLDA
jgi:hypothetical protein